MSRVQDLNEERINELIEKIKNLLEDFQEIGYEISKNMCSCIENKQEVAYISFLSSRCTEIQDTDGKWTKVWEDFDIFRADKSLLPTNAEYWFSRLYVQTRS